MKKIIDLLTKMIYPSLISLAIYFNCIRINETYSQWTENEFENLTHICNICLIMFYIFLILFVIGFVMTIVYGIIDEIDKKKNKNI